MTPSTDLSHVFHGRGQYLLLGNRPSRLFFFGGGSLESLILCRVK